MAAWHYVTVLSLLTLSGAGACSGSSTAQPAARGGGAGAEAGGAAGKAGAPGQGKAGSGQQSAGSAGTPAMPEGGSDGSGMAGESVGGEAGAPMAPDGQAVHGKLCPVESTIGVVQLNGFPTPYVTVTLYDRQDPWLTAPELSTPTCGFHHYTPGNCAACEAGEVCSLASECVLQPRTVKDATLVVTAGAETQTLMAHPQLGGISAALDIGSAASSFGMKLSWGDSVVNLEPMPVADGNLEDVAVTTASDTYDMPGALDASWGPSESGAFVRSRIPINHHAGGPTFTDCVAPESAGAFHADADMIDPLAVITGLEFQGLDHVYIAAANTPDGCVEFQFGERVFASPQ